MTTKLKGVDLDAPGNINGVPVLEVDMESFEEKPWRKPGVPHITASSLLQTKRWLDIIKETTRECDV